MIDDEEEDPDFSPGEEEEPESEEISLDEEEGSVGEVSDTNAPYADAAEEPARAGTSRGEQ